MVPPDTPGTASAEPMKSPRRYMPTQESDSSRPSAASPEEAGCRASGGFMVSSRGLLQSTGKLPDCDLETLARAVADDHHHHRGIRRGPGHQVRELSRIHHLLAVELDDDVTLLDVALGCGGTFVHPLNVPTPSQVHRRFRILGPDHYGHAQVAAGHAAHLQQIGQDLLGGID